MLSKNGIAETYITIKIPIPYKPNLNHLLLLQMLHSLSEATNKNTEPKLEYRLRITANFKKSVEPRFIKNTSHIYLNLIINNVLSNFNKKLSNFIIFLLLKFK